MSDTDSEYGAPGVGPSAEGAARTSTITALFDNRSQAEATVERLREAELGAATVQLVLGSGEGSAPAAPDGIWTALENFFFPSEDREIYAEGLRRGGYLVTVSGIDDAGYMTARDILDDEGTIDLDERVDLWRRDGWSGWQRSTSPGMDTRAPTEETFGAAAGDHASPSITRDHARSSATVRAYRSEAGAKPVESSGDASSFTNRDEGQPFGEPSYGAPATERAGGDRLGKDRVGWDGDRPHGSNGLSPSGRNSE
ncbi:hypothetical protein GOL30_08620 [Sinorhizobium medicae]|uniref:General stress protein 17M-like domain-containing protein n=2 Tax=Sinorhizobium medicae TaxID=110321 RepID=A0A6G1WI45_9HYPH|nr:hypothetical protein [Sinorhizobium medicae]ABR62879.1 hypothetical protein Smed_4072 [Sinorhizobium medicae WSM419]MBO1942571.1 hypothetical protein [Sinorhizobium medicae]MDX0403371.1 hypothetical protein [Sinorhizobium medicae]MDX0409623.1 hypothetical protein [Sinorhizobium medicae]MDX0415740.1 hypothetical protein [Sinorhizobium medicae]